MSEYDNSVNQARQLYDDGNYEEATKKYLNALTHTNNKQETAIVWAELAWSFYKLRSFKQVVDAVENALTQDEGYPLKMDLYRILGYSYFALDEDNKGREALLKSLEIDSESDKQKFIFYELGKIEFRNQKYDESEKYLIPVEDYYKANHTEYWLSLLFFRGFNNYYLGHIEESYLLFNTLIENTEDPISQSNGHYGLAYIAFDKKDFLGTINICEKVTALNANFFDMESLGFLMCASFYNLGRHDIFIKYFDEMRKNFKNGRYLDELNKMRESINDSGSTPKH